MQKITPFLWFDHQAEEAANFYVAQFPDSKIVAVSRYGASGPGPVGSVMTVSFQLAGQNFIALNGGPGHPFTQAISLVVNCETQPEIDELWERLSADGRPIECGWLVDRYGLSWQVVPARIAEWMADPAKCDRVMSALLAMTKLDLAALERAAADQPD